MLKLPEISEESLEERARVNLNQNLPFFYKIFKIGLLVEDLENLSARIKKEFGIPTSPISLAIILGVHTPHSVPYTKQWEEYVNYCVKAMGWGYIPFIDDGVFPVRYKDNLTGYISIARSKIYPSGRYMKRLLSKEQVDEIKKNINGTQDENNETR